MSKATRVVTISIGGNDAGYIPSLFAYCYMPPTRTSEACSKILTALPAALPTIEANVTKTLTEIRRRAPRAQIMLVSYLRLMPDNGVCDPSVVPGGIKDLSAGAVAEGRLEARMRAAAQATKVEFISMRNLSADHSACAGVAQAWANGVTAAAGDGSPLHPRAIGMEAVARALGPLVKARLGESG